MNGEPVVLSDDLKVSGDTRWPRRNEISALIAAYSTAEATNLLINGGFSFAQRQTPGTLTTYGASALYAADRWQNYAQNASVQYQRVDTIAAYETGLNARYYGKYKKITNTGKVIVGQIVESINSSAARGQSVTLSIKMRYTVAASMVVRLGLLSNTGTVDVTSLSNGAFGANGTDPTWSAATALVPTATSGGVINGSGVDCTLTGDWVKYTATFSVPTTSKNLIAVVWSNSQLSANDELNLSEAGLYSGANPTAWNPRSYEHELLLCERYYQKTFELDTAPVTNIGGLNLGELTGQQWIANTHYFYFLWQLKCRMRVAPTVVTYNPKNTNAEARNYYANADGNTTGGAATTDRVNIATNTPVATGAGDLIVVHATANSEL